MILFYFPPILLHCYCCSSPLHKTMQPHTRRLQVQELVWCGSQCGSWTAALEALYMLAAAKNPCPADSDMMS